MTDHFTWHDPLNMECEQLAVVRYRNLYALIVILVAIEL